MPHFQDNEKKTIKNDRQSAILDFISAKLSRVILVWVLTFCIICMVQLFCFDFVLRKYYKITQIQHGHFKIVCSQKLIRSLIDIAVHICQKKKICRKLFPEMYVLTSISLLVALVIKRLIIWESKCHQKSPCVIWWLCEVWGSRSS